MRRLTSSPFLSFVRSFLCTEPTTTVLGTPEMYIDTGSTVNLTCIVQGLNEPPTSIQWTHNGYVSIRIIPAAQTIRFAFVMVQIRFAQPE